MGDLDSNKSKRIVLKRKARSSSGKDSAESVGLSKRRSWFADRVSQLTFRDLEILKFLLDMKFANLDQIHRKFFLTLYSGKQSLSQKWAANRLRGLKKEGILKSQPGVEGRMHYYVVTERGRSFLQASRVSEEHLKAVPNIDIRTFQHDFRVVNARIALERAGRAQHWDSERRMKAGLSPSFNLTDQFLPDGIYRNTVGHSIAFELEIALKEPRRYTQKVEKYMEAFRRAAGTANPLKGALFVATSELVYKKLSEAVSRYPGFFKVERYDELITSAEKESSLEQVKENT